MACSNGSVTVLNKLKKIQMPLTFLFGNPYAIKNMCNAPNLLVCYEDDSIFQKQAFFVLTWRRSSKRNFACSVCAEYPFGSGIVNK